MPNDSIYTIPFYHLHTQSPFTLHYLHTFEASLYKSTAINLHDAKIKKEIGFYTHVINPKEFSIKFSAFAFRLRFKKGLKVG